MPEPEDLPENLNEEIKLEDLDVYDLDEADFDSNE